MTNRFPEAVLVGSFVYMPRNAIALNAIILSCTYFQRIFISSENNFSVSVNATHAIELFLYHRKERCLNYRFDDDRKLIYFSYSISIVKIQFNFNKRFIFIDFLCLLIRFGLIDKIKCCNKNKIYGRNEALD